ncbi:MAG: NAD kinase [Paludibacteraceae bacterium]|nr:NAD kinase [Paludibacteraceae bacterium]
MIVAIFANSFRAETMREVKHLIDYLQAKEIEIVLSHELHQEPFGREYASIDDYNQDSEQIDFAISIGGDGTFLTTASLVGHLDIPILGINCGHLGFLAEAQTANAEQVLDQLLNGEYTIEKRRMLEVSCSADNKILSPFALNEVAVLKQGLSSMISIDTYLNGEYLHTYKADGLLVATPTGSTAYNLSIGGPLLEPHTRAIVLSPVATHSLSVRPLVISDDCKIDLKISSRNGNYMISIDGRSQVFADDVTLHIEKPQRTIKLVQLHGSNFVQSLKDKLQWGR